MGYTLGAIATYISAAYYAAAAYVSTTLGVSIATATSIVNFAISTTLSLAASQLARPSLDPQQQKQAVKQPIGPRRRAYGRVKISGIWAFLKNANPWLYQIIMLVQGPVDEFEEHWLGDDKTTLTGNDVTTPARYQQHDKNYAQIYWRYGDPDQTAFERLVDDFPSYWTEDHRLLGIACAAIALLSPPANRFTEVFDAGLPVYNAVLRAAQVWDPRTNQDPDDPSTWAWTMNAALIVLDYVWHKDGMRLPRYLAEKAIDDWSAKADKADELMPLKAGGAERRFQLSGLYELTSPPKQVLPFMLEPMDARLYMRGDGGIVLDIGEYVEPTVIISDMYIVSYSGLTRARPKTDLKNEIHASFVSPDYNYIPQEADVWENQDSIDVDGAQAATLDLTWCPSHRQARVRMKVEAYRQAPDWSGTIVTNIYGLKAFDERLVRFQISELGIDEVFEVQKAEINVQNGNCTFSVVSMPAAAYAWDPDIDEGVAPGKGDDIVVVHVPDPPLSPTGIGAVNASGTVTVTFRAPNDPGDLTACRVWRATSVQTFTSAIDVSGPIYCSPNQALTYLDAPGVGSWKYWATAENTVGDLSTETGPATVTV